MKNRKVLITGGTRGIGLAIAERFLKAGCKVTVTGTRPDGEGPKGSAYLSCDFSDREAAKNFAEKIAAMDFDILINNAGRNKIGPVADYDSADFEAIQQVNLIAPFLLCRAVVPGMCRRKFGRIVNIGSIFGVVSKPMRSAYSTSKFGLLGLTKALALEVAKENVLVNALAPGFIDTDLTRRVLGEKGIAEIVQRIPMGRLGKAEEIAEAALFLAGEANTYLTGQNIVVDGGFVSE